MKAPWHDYAGNEIHDGDVIVHPSGEEGRVVMVDCDDAHDKWRVDYGDEHLSRLSMQIGDKGRAVVKPEDV